MFEILIALGCLFMFFGPVMIAWRLSGREQLRCAQEELETLDLIGKRSDGTLYSLPGYIVIQPKRASRPSAGSRAA